MSDKEIIEGILAGGKKYAQALDSLYANEKSKIVALVRKYRGATADGHDIFQDTLIEFVAQVKGNKFKRECTIGTYLYRIAYCKWMNELKRLGRHADYDEMKEDQPGLSVMNLYVIPFSKECQELVRSLMALLGQACQTLLDLRFFQHKSFKEIAIIMEYKDDQVPRTKQHKCLESLREKSRNNKMLLECLNELQ